MFDGKVELSPKIRVPPSITFSEHFPHKNIFIILPLPVATID